MPAASKKANKASRNGHASRPANPVQVTFDVYKNRPLICLARPGAWPMKFGPGKAHLILDAIEEIRAFAEANPMATADND